MNDTASSSSEPKGKDGAKKLADVDEEEESDPSGGNPEMTPEDQLSPEELIERYRNRIAELEEQNLNLLEELENASDCIAELEETVREQDEIIEENFRAAEASRKSAADETTTWKEVIRQQQESMDQQDKLLSDSTMLLEQIQAGGSPTSAARAGQGPGSGAYGSVAGPMPPQQPPGAPLSARGQFQHRRASSEHRRPMRPIGGVPPQGGAAAKGFDRPYSLISGAGPIRAPRPPLGPGTPRVPSELHGGQNNNATAPAAVMQAAHTPRGSRAGPPPGEIPGARLPKVRPSY